MPVTLEAAEKSPICSGRSRVRDELRLELREVDVAVGVLGDRHDVGDRLAPGQLVGVVLERPDEHHRPLVGRDRAAEVVAVVEVGREAQVEDADQLVDRAGRSRSRRRSRRSSSSPPTARG